MPREAAAIGPTATLNNSIAAIPSAAIRLIITASLLAIPGGPIVSRASRRVQYFRASPVRGGTTRVIQAGGSGSEPEAKAAREERSDTIAHGARERIDLSLRCC